MEIQQKERESLVAYMHRFKREAKRCNFDSNKAMIRIFVKGLRNAHTLQHEFMKRDPNSGRCHQGGREAHQLTTTLLPSSTVYVMSSEDDKCFQCEESGQMSCHCPNIRCFDCDKYSHVVADWPDKIPP